MNNFWLELPRPFFILAPMEAVTDVVFRHVIAEAGRPDVFFTEFTNAASYASEKGIHSTRGRLTFTPDEHPMVAQIWGNNPEHFSFMARGLAEMGYKGIDINTGCPDKAVVKQGSGSGLIGNCDLTAQLISAAKEGGLPVSVKARLGISRPEEYKDWLGFLLKQDIANLTIHLRTRKEMSKVPAHFELIPDIIALRDELSPATLLTINGDIEDRTHGLELIDKYPGVDGIMIGRGVFHNPFAFKENLTSDIPVTDEQKTILLDLLRFHLDLHDKYSAELEPRRFDPLKRFFKIYIRDFPGASELREQLMHTKSTDEVRKLLPPSL